MQAIITTRNLTAVSELRESIEEEASSGYYTYPGRSVAVVPFNNDGVLPDSFVGQSGKVYAGGTVTPDGHLYCSCRGNWMWVRPDGKIVIGGRRHGVIGFIPKEIKTDPRTTWIYPEGGTLTPNLAPWNTVADEELKERLKKEAGKKLATRLGVEHLMVRRKTLRGWKRARLDNYITKVVGVQNFAIVTEYS